MSADRFAQFDALMGELREGTLTPDRAARLNDLLASDEPARREYALQVLLRADLRQRFGGRLGARTADLQRGNAAAGDATGTHRLGFAPVAWSIAATVLLSAAAVGIYLFVIGSAADDPQPSGPPIVTLIESTDTVIYENDVANPGSEYPSGTYSIESGSAQFLLTNRVTVDLYGSTMLRMNDTMHATLSQGTAAFTCPPGSEGFTVAVPGGVRVVDLGTRFEVNVNGDGLVRVFVHEGQVELQRDQRPAIQMVAGDYRRVGQDGAVESLSEGYPIRIRNHRFEEHSTQRGLEKTPADWEVADGVVQAIYPAANLKFGASADGMGNVGYIESHPSLPELKFAIWQELDTTAIPGARYELSYAVGNRTSLHGPPNYRVTLLTSDGQVLVSQANPVQTVPGRFVDAVVVGIAPEDASGNLVVRFEALPGTNQAFFDDVELRVTSKSQFHSDEPTPPLSPLEN